jgi:hypothetical protein
MAGAAVVAGAVTWSAGAAYGLWNTSASVPAAQVWKGQIGFGVSEPVRPGKTPDAHTNAVSPEDVLSVNLGPAEAAEVVEAGATGMAWYFDVAMTAQGNAGIDYDIAADFKPGGIFALSQVNVFSVPDPTGCTVAAGKSAATGSQIDGNLGISPDYAQLKQVMTTWCVTAVLDPAAIDRDQAGLGHYSNTATVTATAPDGSIVIGTDTWEADLLPDPSEELAGGGLKVTHNVTGPQ